MPAHTAPQDGAVPAVCLTQENRLRQGRLRTSLRIRLPHDPGDSGKDIGRLQYPLTACADRGQTFFPGVIFQKLGDPVQIGLVSVGMQRQQRPRGTALRQIGRAKIDGMGIAEPGIRQLFRPKEIDIIIFKDEMVFIVPDGIPLVVNGIPPPAKDIDRIAKAAGGRFHKSDAPSLRPGVGFCWGDEPQALCFSWERDAADFI